MPIRLSPAWTPDWEPQNPRVLHDRVVEEVLIADHGFRALTAATCLQNCSFRDCEVSEWEDVEFRADALLSGVTFEEVSTRLFFPGTRLCNVAVVGWMPSYVYAHPGAYDPADDTLRLDLSRHLGDVDAPGYSRKTLKTNGSLHFELDRRRLRGSDVARTSVGRVSLWQYYVDILEEVGAPIGIFRRCSPRSASYREFCERYDELVDARVIIPL